MGRGPHFCPPKGRSPIPAPTAATRGAVAPFLPPQLPPGLDLPSGPPRCPGSVTCGWVAGRSSCHADLGGWQREQRYSSSPSPSKQGANPASLQTPTALGGLFALWHYPPTHRRGEGEKSPPASCSKGGSQEQDMAMPCAQSEYTITPGLCSPVSAGSA